MAEYQRTMTASTGLLNVNHDFVLPRLGGTAGGHLASHLLIIISVDAKVLLFLLQAEAECLLRNSMVLVQMHMKCAGLPFRLMRHILHA